MQTGWGVCVCILMGGVEETERESETDVSQTTSGCAGTCRRPLECRLTRAKG